MSDEVFDDGAFDEQLSADEQADVVDEMTEQQAADELTPHKVDYEDDVDYSRGHLDQPEETAADVHNRAHIFSRGDVEDDAKAIQEQRDADDLAARPTDAQVEELRQARILADAIVEAQRRPVPDPAKVATKQAEAAVRREIHLQDDTSFAREMEAEVAADEHELEKIEAREEIEQERRRVAAIDANFGDPVPEQEYGGSSGEGVDRNVWAMDQTEGWVDVEGRARLIQRETDRNTKAAVAQFMRERKMDE
ncbi:MAG: hypothetical protein IH830_03045 [Planctomycetes bacterium]|nr:hypothetical protein [Planctomycetota bacterium]